jgi:hypothetical protein
MIEVVTVIAVLLFVIVVVVALVVIVVVVVIVVRGCGFTNVKFARTTNVSQPPMEKSSTFKCLQQNTY